MGAVGLGGLIGWWLASQGWGQEVAMYGERYPQTL